MVTTGAMGVCFWTPRQLSSGEVSLLAVNSHHGCKTCEASDHIGHPTQNPHSLERPSATRRGQMDQQAGEAVLLTAQRSPGKPAIRKHHRFFVFFACRCMATHLGHISALKGESLALSHKCTSWSFKRSDKYHKICNSITSGNVGLTRLLVHARNGISSLLVGSYRLMTEVGE